MKFIINNLSIYIKQNQRKLKNSVIFSNLTPLHTASISCLCHSILCVGKLITGIYSSSFFTCVSACYSFFIVFAKIYILYNLFKERNNLEQLQCYKISGVLIVLASLFYVIYSIRQFYVPDTTIYEMHVAIVIACFTFFEIGLNIKGIIIERKNSSFLYQALKMINLSSSCICLVLTQTAILSFSTIQSKINSTFVANGILGILMGGITTSFGIIMIVRSYKLKK